MPIPIPYNIYCSIKSWFAIALAELRTRRILRQKADFKQSNHNFTVAKLSLEKFKLMQGSHMQA